MKKKDYRLLKLIRPISEIIILCIALALTACAGQQSAQHLAGLEISTMLEYEQAINKTIAAEDQYYKQALTQLNKNLKQMNEESVTDTALDRRALHYDHIWHKNPPSQHDILEMIDTVYKDFEAVTQNYDAHIVNLNEQYFSKIVKLNIQQDNLEKSIAALGKLYARDESNEQTNLIKDYLVNTLNKARELSNYNNKENPK